MANIYSLQLLRNGQIFTSYADAKNAILTSTAQDGVIKLARYTDSTAASGDSKYQTSTVKTIFGIYADFAGGTGWTIYDSYYEIIKNLQDQIDSMTGGAGSIAQQIQAALDQLDFSGATGNVITQVTQTNGLVGATGANVGTLELTGYEQGSDTDDVAATDTINQAFAKLQNQIDELSGSTDDAIEALDGSITAETGYYINKVDEVDGKISGTTAALPTVAAISSEGQAITAVSQSLGTVDASYGDIAAAHVTVADADGNLDATNVEDALAEIYSGYVAGDTAIVGDATESGNTLGKLEDRIEALDADAKEYHIVKTTTGLPETIKERYSLVDADGNVSGDTVDIPKDSHIVSIAYDGTTQKLTYTYLDASGNTQSTDVDMSELVLETEFGSGITVTNHVAHGVVDPTSETFLTVGAGGFKLDGVQDAIDAAVSSASTDLQEAVDELSGKAVTSIASADGSVTATKGTAADGTVSYDLSTDASKVKVSSAYTAGSNAPIATGDTLDVALAKLEKQVAAANASVQKDANATHLTVTTGTGLNNETIYTIGESDIASASDLTAEIAARKAVDGVNGDAYTADTSANYISGASSLYGADQALDAALKTVADSANSAQTEIDAIETAVGLNNDGTYNANTSNTYTNDATSVADAVDKLDAAVKDNADAIEGLQDSYISGITMNGSDVTVTDNVAALTAIYTNTAANSENGMVITTDANGGLEFQFGTLDVGTY